MALYLPSLTAVRFNPTLRGFFARLVAAGKPPADEEAMKLLYERATLPDLINWLERNPDRAAELRPDEINELVEMQAPGGPLERLGVEHFVEMIERRRHLMCQVRLIAGTEYLELVEQMIGLIFEKVNQVPVRQDRPRR